MLKYLIERVILFTIAMFVIMTVLYILTKVSMYRIWSLPHPISEDFVSAYFDYKSYLTQIVTNWDWGLIPPGIPIWDVILLKFWVSLKYNLIAFVIYFVGGVAFGVIGAYYKNRLLDYIISFFSMLFNSIPGFVFILILILFFGYHLKWFPPQEPFSNATSLSKFKGYFIPIIALSLGPMGHISQLVRGEMLDSMQSPKYLLLRAKGLTKKQAFLNHGIKDSMVVLVPEIIPLFVYVLNMSFVIEYTYNINGIAKLFFKSVISFGEENSAIAVNTEIVVPIALLFMGLIMIFSLFSDIAVALIDPRIRIRGRKTG